MVLTSMDGVGDQARAEAGICGRSDGDLQAQNPGVRPSRNWSSATSQLQGCKMPGGARKRASTLPKQMPLDIYKGATNFLHAPETALCVIDTAVPNAQKVGDLAAGQFSDAMPLIVTKHEFQE